MNLINEIRNEVEYRCKQPSNFFGYGCFEHIESVAFHAVQLAKLYGADQEVCEIAGWLHDIASVTDYELYKEHHIHGMDIAEKILKKFNYPQDKIELVKKCIYNHRGSLDSNRLSLEEVCVADADAISHYDNIPSLLHLAYVQRKLDIDEGRQFVKDKLDRSFSKMSSSSKAYYQDKKDMVDLVFGFNPKSIDATR